MRIIISAIGKLSKNSAEYNIIKEYITRIPWNVTIKEFEVKNTNNVTKEGELLLKSIDKNYKKIVLDEKGQMFSSNEFAKFITNIQLQESKLAFIIGGAYGHSKQVMDEADHIISLSKMTLTHIMARVFLIEQIYRSYTINSNHPYHKK
ncbi:Ribosomal RNA large subunit methyltransferase H [Rickettsiales bacterium Ac37b]|nr:Ribosomal RNA large subunit methyltransferase H [Rickettsiales bacterium Ac37b]